MAQDLEASLDTGLDDVLEVDHPQQFLLSADQQRSPTLTGDAVD